MQKQKRPQVAKAVMKSLYNYYILIQMLQKDIIKRVKVQITEWKKICVNHTLNKIAVDRISMSTSISIYLENLLNKKNQIQKTSLTTQFRIYKGFQIYFSKEDLHRANKHRKECQNQ
jgi:hypothetical protein